MMYVYHLRIVYGDSVELRKVYTQEQKCNMNTKKLGVVEFLDKDEVVCGDEDVVACLDEVVLEFLDNNGKDDIYVDFIHANPLEQLLEETLGGQ